MQDNFHSVQIEQTFSLTPYIFFNGYKVYKINYEDIEWLYLEVKKDFFTVYLHGYFVFSRWTIKEIEDWLDMWLTSFLAHKQMEGKTLQEQAEAFKKSPFTHIEGLYCTPRSHYEKFKSDDSRVEAHARFFYNSFKEKFNCSDETMKKLIKNPCDWWLNFLIDDWSLKNRYKKIHITYLFIIT